MQIVTAEEMRTTDRVTVERYGVPSIDLMRHAGGAVARFVEREFSACRRIVALCGKGNNGGDGFVAARALSEAGRSVHVLLLGDSAELKGDAKAAFDEMKLDPVVINNDADLDKAEVRAILEGADLIRSEERRVGKECLE